MYLSPLARPRPIADTRPNRWFVRTDIPWIERAGEACRLLSHRVDRGQLFFVVRFSDGAVLEYLPGDLECEQLFFVVQFSDGTVLEYLPGDLECERVCG